MTAVTGCTGRNLLPGIEKNTILVLTPATADSGDTVDLTSATVTGGPTLSAIDFLICWDKSTGDIVTATDSSGTVTIDAAGATTNHTYAILAMGSA